jgi:hypothetical protein
MHPFCKKKKIKFARVRAPEIVEAIGKIAKAIREAKD